MPLLFAQCLSRDPRLGGSARQRARLFKQEQAVLAAGPAHRKLHDRDNDEQQNHRQQDRCEVESSRKRSAKIYRTHIYRTLGGRVRIIAGRR